MGNEQITVYKAPSHRSPLFFTDGTASQRRDEQRKGGRKVCRAQDENSTHFHEREKVSQQHETQCM